MFLWSPLVIISPRDKSVEFPKPPCWLTQFQVQLPEACLPLALLHQSSPAPRARVSPQLHAGSPLGRLLSSPQQRAALGGSAGCCLPLPNTSGALYEDSFLCAEHHPSAGCTPCRPRCLGPARLSIAPRGGSHAAPLPHVNKRGAAGADWLRRTAAAPPSARTAAGGEGLQPGVLPVLPLCPFARRAFRSVGSTMTVARLDQGQRYRPRMAFLKKVRAELLRVTGSAALGVSTGGTDRTRADGAMRCSG